MAKIDEALKRFKEEQFNRLCIEQCNKNICSNQVNNAKKKRQIREKRQSSLSPTNIVNVDNNKITNSVFLNRNFVFLFNQFDFLLVNNMFF